MLTFQLLAMGSAKGPWKNFFFFSVVVVCYLFVYGVGTHEPPQACGDLRTAFRNPFSPLPCRSLSFFLLLPSVPKPTGLSVPADSPALTSQHAVRALGLQISTMESGFIMLFLEIKLRLPDLHGYRLYPLSQPHPHPHPAAAQSILGHPG